jgi:hypothetical protein
MRTVLAITLAVALPALATAAEPGAVDFQKKVVKCTGSGAANLRDAQNNPAVARIGAEKAAKLDAVRSCMEVINGMTVTQGQTAAGVLASDKAVAGKVQGAVKGFKVVDKRYFEDGGVELDVEVPVDGVLSDALLPKGEAKSVPSSGEPAGSCLVVDARGRKLLKALAPRVLDEAGGELYGPLMLNPTARKLGATAIYAKDFDAAKKDQPARTGDKPVNVRAVGADGADVVITTADAAALKGKNLGFLAEGRVVILTD